MVFSFSFQGNESFEKLASMGLIANLTVYLQTRFNMDGIQLVNVFNIWSGSTNVTPLLGAFLSDTYLGRFRTLICGSTASFLVKSSICSFPITHINCDKIIVIIIKMFCRILNLLLSFVCMNKLQGWMSHIEILDMYSVVILENSIINTEWGTWATEYVLLYFNRAWSSCP